MTLIPLPVFADIIMSWELFFCLNVQWNPLSLSAHLFGFLGPLSTVLFLNFPDLHRLVSVK